MDPYAKVAFSFIVLIIILSYVYQQKKLQTKRWILKSVTVLVDASHLTAPLFQVRFMDTFNKNVSFVNKEWKMFRGSYFVTYGYTGGLFTELENLFPREFVFPQASYSSLANNEARCKVLFSSLQKIENHPVASKNDVVLQFLGIKYPKCL